MRSDVAGAWIVGYGEAKMGLEMRSSNSSNGLYPTGSGKPLPGFKQRSNQIIMAGVWQIN